MLNILFLGRSSDICIEANLWMEMMELTNDGDIRKLTNNPFRSPSRESEHNLVDATNKLCPELNYGEHDVNPIHKFITVAQMAKT